MKQNYPIVVDLVAKNLQYETLVTQITDSIPHKIRNHRKTPPLIMLFSLVFLELISDIFDNEKF